MGMKQREAARGAAPEGATDEKSASAAVRKMFNEIAPHYDLLNHLLSCNVDRIWWHRVASVFSPVLARHDAKILDLCCGTGDLAMALSRRRKKSTARRMKVSPVQISPAQNPPIQVSTTRVSPITAADFAHSMLMRASSKIAAEDIVLLEADALDLPFERHHFDLVVSAFGFRNLANYDAGLREIFRVIRPGGQMGILEFSEPDGWLGILYGLYFRKILPAVGSVLGGVKGPYSYLPASVARFPSPREMRAQMESAGFTMVQWTPYTGGIAGLYSASKPL